MVYDSSLRCRCSGLRLWHSCVACGLRFESPFPNCRLAAAYAKYIERDVWFGGQRRIEASIILSSSQTNWRPRQVRLF